jgi:hypothetical protein
VRTNFSFSTTPDASCLPLLIEEGNVTALATHSPSSIEEGVRGWSQIILVTYRFPWNKTRRAEVGHFLYGETDKSEESPNIFFSGLENGKLHESKK